MERKIRDKKRINIFFGRSFVICFMLLFTGVGVASATVTGDPPNPTGNTIIDQDTVWDGESNIYCGGDIIVGNPSKRINFDIKNSHVTVKGRWTMGGSTPVNFKLLGSTIFFDVKDGTPELPTLGSGYINTNQMMIIEDTLDLSKPSRIELKNSAIRGTDYTYRGGGVLIKSGWHSAEHTLIVDNVKFSYMGGTTNIGYGYAALNTKYWGASTLASDSSLTNLDFYYCGWGINLVCQDGIELDGATTTRGYMAFVGGKSYTNLHMDKSCEGLYNPCDGALIRNSWFDSNNCKFNIMSASNVIFEYNYVTLAPFNAGDGSWPSQGNNNIIRHCTLDQVGIASRKDETKIINNTFYRGAPFGGNVPIRAWGNNFLIKDNIFTEGGTAIYLIPHPTYDRRGGHIVSGNTINGATHGIRLEKEDNVLCIDNIINAVTYDIYFDGDNNNIKFINNKFDEAKVHFSDSSDIFLNYYYLDVKVVDSSSNPVQGATITITNNVDSNYPSINANGGTKTSFTTKADGHTPLPSDTENSAAILDYWQTKSEKREMSYTIIAEKDGYINSITVNPDSSWYRSNPNTYQNTVTIVLETGPDTTPPTASNGQPTGTITDNTPTLSVTSNEPATCKGSIDTDETYNNMDFTFTGTGTFHSYDVITPLSEGSHIVYIRCKDTAGNTATSSYSWGFTIEMPIPDTTPPAAVTIAASNPTSNSIKLTWTSPGDGGNTGTASQYDIRYSTSEITEANWNSATQCTSEPIPQIAGSSETFTVTGLSSTTTYYFALKTADEVPNWSGISNSPGGTTLEPAGDLVGYWHFDEGTGNIAYDSSGNNNDGTLTNMDPLTDWVDGKIGDYALDFDGVDDYIEIPSDTSLKPDLVSVEAWIKIEGGAGTERYIVDKDTPLTTGYGYRIKLHTSNKIYFEVRNSGTGMYKRMKSTNAYTDSNWHHVVGTYNGENTYLYIDGVSQGVYDYNTGSGVIAYKSPVLPLRVGARSYSTPAAEFNGIIDEVRIYNRALSAAEILEHYNQGLRDCCPHLSTESQPSVEQSQQFDFNLTYTHDNGASGGIHLHWLSENANFISVTGCTSPITGCYDSTGSLCTCGNPNCYQIVECSVNHNDKVQTNIMPTQSGALQINTRAWDSTNDAVCGDFDRYPSGTCSLNCDLFPDDVIACDTSTTSITINPAGGDITPPYLSGHSPAPGSTNVIRSTIVQENTWGSYVYKSPVPIDFLTAYSNSAYCFDPVVISQQDCGDFQSLIGEMQKCKGYTSQNSFYYFNSNNLLANYGIFGTGFSTADCADCRSGALCNVQSMIFVR